MTLCVDLVVECVVHHLLNHDPSLLYTEGRHVNLLRPTHTHIIVTCAPTSHALIGDVCPGTGDSAGLATYYGQ